jgi:cbb3-type cytochrome oxidase subunit 3
LGFPLSDWLTLLIPELAKYYVGLIGTMLGSFVIMGRRWGTVITSRKFAPFWNLVAFFLVEIGVVVFLPDAVTPFVQRFLFLYQSYITGMTSALIGTFIAWFVYSFEYNHRTQYKWAAILACYLITAGNIAVCHYGILGTAC